MTRKTHLPTKILIATLILTPLTLSIPTANFTAQPNTGPGPLEVTFNASQSTSNTTIKNYTWDFNGDGYKDAEGETTKHTYYGLGEYNATLTVKNTEGEENKATEQIEVQKPENGVVLRPKAEGTGKGYLYLEALAGRYMNNTFTCANTSVTTEVQGKTYELKEPEEGYCVYSKEIYTGSGDYSVKFTAHYPNKTKEETIEAQVKGEKPKIQIHAPAEEKKPSKSELYIETEAIEKEYSLEGNFTASLNNESTSLTLTDVGTYIGTINTGSPGNKTLEILFENEEWSITKEKQMKILSQDEYEEETQGPKLHILTPSKKTELNKNESTLIEIELIQANGLPYNDQEINYTVKKYGNITEKGVITQGDRLYSKSYRFEEPGYYNFTLNWKGVEKTLEFKVGPEEEIPEEKKLQVDVVTPRSSIYATESELMIHTVVKKQDKFIDNASVICVLDNQEEIPLTSLGGGEYDASLGTLPEGRHTVTAEANYSGENARETVPFKVSGKSLEVNVMKPNLTKTIEVKKGVAVEIKVNVTDQNNVPASNAMVKAEFTSPTGKGAEATGKQKPGGVYILNYHPETSGAHEVEITAQKPDHVSGKLKTTLQVEVKEEKTEAEKFIGNLGLRTLLKLALGLAIIILLLALVTRIL